MSISVGTWVGTIAKMACLAVYGLVPHHFYFIFSLGATKDISSAFSALKPKCPRENFVRLFICLRIPRLIEFKSRRRQPCLVRVLSGQNPPSYTASIDHHSVNTNMIFTDVLSSNARLILRVYFLILIGLITWLADGVLQYRAQLRIMKHGSIRVHTALGWLQGFQLVKIGVGSPPASRRHTWIQCDGDLLFALSKVTDLLTAIFVVQLEGKVTVSVRAGFGPEHHKTFFDERAHVKRDAIHCRSQCTILQSQ